MKKNQPIFGSLGSNYTWKFALQVLWWYLFPPNSNDTQTKLADNLNQHFPDYSQPYFFATGRDAIEFVLKNLPISRGAKVLTQAFSCAAIEEAILSAKCQPVFVDLSKNSVNLGVDTLQAAFVAHPEAKVVLVQHLFGCAADIVAIKDWCEQHNLFLIEDLAQSFAGTTQTGEKLGSFADAVVTSFGRDKIVDVVSGGCCLFRRGLLSVEPKRLSLRRRSSWHQAVYPLLTVMIRATFSIKLGKLLQYIAKRTSIIRSPIIRTSRPLEKLSIGQAKAVIERLQTLTKELEHRSKIVSVYAYLLKKYCLPSDCLNSAHSLLRFPLLLTDPDTLSQQLKNSNFYLSDRWYRAAVDSGTIAWASSYRSGSAPRAETLASSILTLPTHRQVSLQTAVRLAVAIHQLLKKNYFYEVKNISDQTTWENWLLLNPEANFLQSWYWGEFQKQLGNQITRLGLYRDNKLVGVALGIFVQAKRGNYCVVPGGPLFDWQDPCAAQVLFARLRVLARQNHCLFIRFRPQLIDNVISRSLICQLNVLPSAMHVTADRTIEINISQDHNELLAQMRKNTRSAIKKAEKIGIRTEVSQDPGKIKEFYEYQCLLAKRHKFVPFSYRFLFEQFKIFVQQDKAFLVSSYQDSQLLAMAFVIVYNQQAVYHYGISTPANAKLPGAYAVQWRVIVEAKQRGCTSYNLWGVAPPGTDKHRFAGVSLFKRGFGGREIQYLPAHDIPLLPIYQLTRWFEFLRKWRRHL